MPNIDTLIQIEDKAKKLLFYNRGGFEAGEESSVLGTLELTTTPQNIDYGTVENPRAIGVFNSGTADRQGSVLVGSDQEVAPGEFCVVSLKSSDRVETQTVTLDASSSAATETYLNLYGAHGSWAIWFDSYAVGGTPSGTEPSHGKDNSIRINLLASANVNGESNAAEMVSQLAQVGLNTGINNTDGFTTPGGSAQGGAWFSDDFEFSYNGDVVTIKDRFLDARTNASAGTSPFTVTSTRNGTGTPRTLSLASDSSLGSEALICVFPN